MVAQKHTLPLPVSSPFQIKGKHTQLWEPKSQVKKTQAVNQVPVTSTSEVSEHLQPRLSRLFVGSTAAEAPTHWCSFLSVY